VAITSPDRDINGDAREYFTRHMRILERCMDLWPVPEMQKQVNAVREAFSADIRKPFVLKPSFPYGSPTTSNSETASLAGSAYGQQGIIPPGSIDGQLNPAHAQYSRQTVSPPISTGPVEVKGDGLSSMNAMGPGQQMMGEPAGWNPTRIFELDARFLDLASSSLIDFDVDSQWNTTFGTPPSVPVIPAGGGGGGPSSQASGPGSTHGATPLSVSDQNGATVHDLHSVASGLTPSVPERHAAPQYAPPPMQNFVTPAMWQESVASVYEGGLKRGWDYDATGMPMTKRR
jgi:hypothetical protein